MEGTTIDPVHWDSDKQWSDLQACCLNNKNTALKPSYESFFQGDDAVWKDMFSKDGIKQKAALLTKQLEKRETDEAVGSDKAILKGVAEQKKQNLEAARAKRQPRTTMKTSFMKKVSARDFEEPETDRK